jgi:hypothetical protein
LSVSAKRGHCVFAARDYGAESLIAGRTGILLSPLGIGEIQCLEQLT